MSASHIVLAVFVTTLWGFSFVVMRDLLDQLPPFLMANPHTGDKFLLGRDLPRRTERRLQRWQQLYGGCLQRGHGLRLPDKHGPLRRRIALHDRGQLCEWRLRERPLQHLRRRGCMYQRRV